VPTHPAAFQTHTARLANWGWQLSLNPPMVFGFNGFGGWLVEVSVAGVGYLLVCSFLLLGTLVMAAYLPACVRNLCRAGISRAVSGFRLAH